jgi:membrane-bound lytic murein transglycosylase MltF
MISLLIAALLVAAPLHGEGAEQKITVSQAKVVHGQSLIDFPVELTSAEEAEVDGMVLPTRSKWLDDFEGMRNRQLIRMLVPNSKTYFFVNRGNTAGLDYELGKAFEKWLNQKYPTGMKNQPWRVAFIPVRRDQLLAELVAGNGDIAGGGLTVTEGRRKSVDFPAPFASGVREALVTGPYSEAITRLEDLAGKEVTVRASSSYFEHLQQLNASFKERGLAPIKIVAADEWLESEDILEMVHAGLIKITVVDRYLADIWQPVYPELQIQEAFYLHSGGDLAWAVRKGSPQLQKVLTEFMQGHKLGTTFGNIVANRYAFKRVHNATSAEEMRKFRSLVAFFEKYGAVYGFDHLMLIAQGYQESRLEQLVRSKAGAVGIMQLLPSTAADPAVGITGIDKDPERNIEAGAKYLRLLTDKYLADSAITPVNRTLMAFAAYNAGPGNLRKFRAYAKKSGKDPNVWFQNVEYGAARIVGQETVSYVSNIYKYYIAYKLIEERNRAVGKGNSL